MRLAAGLVVAVLGLMTAAQAQTLGEITGQVADSTGAMIAGANVTVTNEATNAVRSVVTNTAGVYSAPSLNPGTYTVKAEAAGFQTVVRSGITLQVQQTARIDFEMQVGQVTEVIEVTGGAPLLTTENATVGAVVENKRIVELPLNGRNFLQLVALSPNVSFGFASNGTAQGRQGGQRSEQNISVSGQRSEFNYFTLDGIDNTDVSFNVYIFLPSIDALQEFKVQSGIFPAEFGRATSQINVSTKPGGNSFHGALFEFLRNNKLDATNYAFTSVHPQQEPFKRNQFGFALGGPVWIPKIYNGRNRLFFMANYEALRDRKGIRSVANVPSVAMRGGDFSGISNRIFDPATRVRQPDGTITAQQFPGNIIPSNRFDPKTQQLLEFYPTPNIPGAGLAQNYQNAEGRRIDQDQFTIRIDFLESSSSTWIGRYSYSDELNYTPQTFPLQGTKLQTFPKQVLLSNIRVLNPSTVNEFRFGYSKWVNENLNYNAQVRDVIGELGGIPGVAEPHADIWGIPQIGISGFSGFGDHGFLPFIDRNDVFQFTDSMSVVRGAHTFKFGGEVRLNRFNELGNSFPRGAFNFDGNATQNPASRAGTGAAFADYMLGLIRTSDAALILADTRLRATSQAYYFDDVWKIRPNLTLNLGLRYENTPPYYDLNDTIVNALVTSNFDPAANPILVRAGEGDFYEGVPFRFHPSIQTARSNTLMGSRRLVNRDNNDFAPRLGLAYNPTPNWTFRWGFGAFYVQDSGNTRFDLGRNVAGRRRGEANNDFPDLTFTTPFQDLSAGTVSVPYVLANMQDRRTPYVLQYLFNIQRQLTRDLALEAGYMGNQGHKLERIIALNIPRPGPGPVASRRPWPELGTVQEVANTVNSNYHSLAIKLQQRYAHGLTFVNSYTWSKAIDTGSAIRTHGTDPLFPQDNYNWGADRGLSQFDVRHRFVSSFLWEVPVGRGRRWMNTGGVANAILGGWQLGSIITVQGGFPLTLLSRQDRANDGQGNYQRPDYNGMEWRLPSDQRGAQGWFDTRAFTLPALYTYGNLGRFTVNGPGMFAWDFSVMKNFRTFEGQHLEFRFEAFNFPNHPNLGPPEITLVSPSFGRIASTATTMREIQFGLKYVF
ncbi:MAG: carboxypeptidase regulatory-like domain-containing protein [Bryobacteraceae bacterium]|nr:carboxypeptidase regulatory-like domain-containing protein [Bryobacteraceae bacterium]